MIKPYFQDKYSVIYHGDCRDILPQLPKVDLVLTDPPYGIDYSASYPNACKFDNITGDKELVAAKYILDVAEKYPICIIWGANNFPQLLPFPGVWLCWDKRLTEAADRMLGWPFELAWVNKRKGKARMYRILHGGWINADGHNIPRFHPTQKPVALFKSVLLDYPGENILDPFMGSGTTLRACKDLGRKAIGIEIEERYCEIAAKRLRQEVLF